MRKSMMSAVAAAAFGTMVLTGCMGDDSDDASSSASSPAATSPAAASPSAAAPDEAASDAGADADAAADSQAPVKLDGGWVGSSDVDEVAMIVKGDKVQLAFRSTDGKSMHACEGLLKQTSMQLSCVDKTNKDRVKGTVEIASDKKIAIAWASGKKDLLTKSGNGQVDFSQWGLPAPAAG
ncbi:hypothetical protein ABT121_32855 [Streptomyces sp. NPDC001928]|uniref:hypothetical protein n=1 Tax=Streptomyces sp. NPDC001928 TaxID=3154404 RepID=UPI00333117AE